MKNIDKVFHFLKEENNFQFVSEISKNCLLTNEQTRVALYSLERKRLVTKKRKLHFGDKTPQEWRIAI